MQLLLPLIASVFLTTACATGGALSECQANQLHLPSRQLPVPANRSEGAVLQAVEETAAQYDDLWIRHEGLVACVTK